MAVNQTELNNFHEFATRALAIAGRELNLEELVDQWSVQTRIHLPRPALSAARLLQLSPVVASRANIHRWNRV